MKELINRWQADMPSFFKKVAALCLVLSAIGAAFEAGADYLPAYTQAIAPHLIVAGIVGAAISKFTVQK